MDERNTNKETTVQIKGRGNVRTAKFKDVTVATVEGLIVRIDDSENLPFWMEIFVPVHELRAYLASCDQQIELERANTEKGGV